MPTITRLGAAAGAIALVSGVVHANIMVYTSEAAFLADVGAHDIEDFEDETAGFLGQTVTVGDLTFSSPGSDIFINDFAHQHGAHNTTPGGSKYLFGDSGIPSFHDAMHMGHVGGLMRAWGAIFTDLEVGPIEFVIDGQLIHSEPAAGGSDLEQFFGFIATDGDSFYDVVTLAIPDITYGIDDVRTALIPGPSAVPLFVVAALTSRRRRRIIR